MGRKKPLRARVLIFAALVVAPTATLLLAPASHAATLNYYRSHSTPLSWPWNLIEGIFIVVLIIGTIIFSMTDRGREIMRRSRRRGIFDSDMTGMYPTMSASTPLPKVKGMDDCPQCGLAIPPGVTKCPKCHWNLHQSQVKPAPGTHTDAVDLAGFAAVAMAPVVVAAEGARTTAAPADTPTPAPPEEAILQVPAAPAESSTQTIGVVQHDIVIGGAVAFREGEHVRIEAESPDPERPEYKYVVTSQALNSKFRLSDLDIFI
ncbi:MAG: zinc ribbon domain-containing protein [Candidatus Geothermincolia bacterium]